MSDHSTYFEEIGGDMVLTNAILLYQVESRHRLPASGSAATFASIHDVEPGNGGAPTIAAGTPLTRAHLRQWAEALGRSAGPEILPPNVLVAHQDMLAWWTPAAVRPAYFNLTTPPDGLRVLAERTIVSVPYPAHLFVATRRSLGVYALAQNERPEAATPLLHSPILNVFVRGTLCWGNIPQPTSLRVAAIAEFEKAVFESWSTHPNPGQEWTISGKGGLVRLWDDLAARRAKRFPVSRLRPFTGVSRSAARKSGTPAAPPLTLRHVVARSQTK